MKCIARRRLVGAAALRPVLVLLALSACTTMPPTEATVLSRAQIAQVVGSPDRTAADRANDVRRKPELLLGFIGVRAGMRALDLSAGGGYTTELLARAVGPQGRVYGQSAPRNEVPLTTAAAPEGDAAPPVVRRVPSPVALAERAKNPAVANIVPVVRKFEEPVPPEVAADGLDLVTMMFNYHDMGHLGVDRAAMNRAVFAALKPGGVYVIADHAGRAGTGISESGTLHRVEEAFVRKEVEAAGFALVAAGDFLRNPEDPRDALSPAPPQTKDEFVLKFVKGPVGDAGK